MDSSSVIERLDSRNHSSIPLTPVVGSQEKDIGSSTTRLGIQPGNEDEDETANHLTGLKLYLVVAGLCISVLLVALVRHPTITTSVYSLNTALGPSDTGNGKPIQALIHLSSELT